MPSDSADADNLHYALAAVAFPALRGLVLEGRRGLVARWYRASVTAPHPGDRCDSARWPSWAGVEPMLWWPGMSHLIRAERVDGGLDLRMVCPLAARLTGFRSGAFLASDVCPPMHRALLTAAGQGAPVRLAAEGVELIALPLSDGVLIGVFRGVE